MKSNLIFLILFFAFTLSTSQSVDVTRIQTVDLGVDLRELSFEFDGQLFEVTIVKNLDLYSEGYKEYRYRDGVLVLKERTPNCHWHAVLSDTSVERFAVSDCSGGYDGSFVYDGKLVFVRPVGSDQESHYVYVAGEEEMKIQFEEPLKMVDQSFMDKKRDTEQLFDGSYYTEIVIYNAKSLFDIQGEGTEAFTMSIANINNYLFLKATQLFGYEIKMIVVAMVTIETADPWGTPSMSSGSVDVSSLLGIFNDYIYGLSDPIAADIYLLFDGRDFSSNTVGYAYVGTICSGSSETGIIQAIGRSVEATATVVAHEVGHIFGMSHDGTGNTCASSGFIMASASSALIDTFSSCSAQYLEDTFDLGVNCLYNIPEASFEDFCGDGFVSGSEECDCGTSETCTDSCCDPNTCKLVEKAKCAGNVCCEDCKFQSKKTVCHTAETDCEQDVMCTGNSATCNFNQRFKNVGDSCSEGACDGEGTCTSLLLQCETWGPYYGSTFGECDSQFTSSDCSKILCSTSSGSCTSLTWNGDQVEVGNGVECDTESFCYEGECTHIDEIPKNSVAKVMFSLLFILVQCLY